MGSSISLKDLRVCHHVSNVLYKQLSLSGQIALNEKMSTNSKISKERHCTSTFAQGFTPNIKRQQALQRTARNETETNWIYVAQRRVKANCTPYNGHN